MSLLRPEVLRELELAKHGLQIVPTGGAWVPMENGDQLRVYSDPALLREEVKRHSKRDADTINGNRDQQRDVFGNAVIDTISEFAPNIKDIILHKQVLTPWDIEQEVSLIEGNIFAGELTLDQLFSFRPAAGWADDRTPIRNYYQWGSGTHPGGGITGGPAGSAR